MTAKAIRVKPTSDNIKKAKEFAKKFLKEYPGDIKSDPSTAKYQQTMDDDQYRFIVNANNKIIGYVNFDIIGQISDDSKFRSINNMFIERNYRGLGYAKDVRMQLLSEKADMPVKTTVISMYRLTERIDYWIEQGFKFWCFAPHNKHEDPRVRAEDVDTSQLLVLLGTDINDNVQADHSISLLENLKLELQAAE
jgi:hypothetical protein